MKDAILFPYHSFSFFVGLDIFKVKKKIEEINHRNENLAPKEMKKEPFPPQYAFLLVRTLAFILYICILKLLV